jgi:hypothetical protein
MKKFFVVLISFALVAGSAFAELSIGGAVGVSTSIISVTVEDGDEGKPTAGGVNAHFGRLDVDYTDESGIFGAHARVGDGSTGRWSRRVWAWWKPIDQFKLQLGQDASGAFPVNYIVGWGFFANDAEDFVAERGYGFTRGTAFFSGFDNFGAVLTLTPVTGLAINLAVPYPAGDPALAEDVYKLIIGQVAYDINGIGQAAVTFQGGSGKMKMADAPVDPTKPTYGWKDTDDNPATAPVWAPGDSLTGSKLDTAVEAYYKAAATYSPGYGDPASIYANFYLTAVENLGINIGFKYTLPYTDKDFNEDITMSAPIAVGLGASYNVSDTFGIKARLAATFAGNIKQKDADDPVWEEGFKFGIQLAPWFDLSIVKVFINLGMEYQANNKQSGNEIDYATPLSWYVNPFITKSVGSGTFYAGLTLGGAPDNPEYDTNKDHIFFKVPIGLEVAF